ncbi:hypothetical protein ADK67_46695 [Saccharothrix sp. NRRL B-16348]|jgi:hypothetical protein|nr:hypothetical protein ADK67_46695 [Saccharothrix sp. NRRL B-16348]
MVLTVLGFALITACGTDAPGREVASLDQPGQTSGNDNGTAADQEKFAQCMKDNGGTLPSFNSGDGENGSVRITPQAEPQRRKNEEAYGKCKQYAPGGGQPEPVDPERIAQQLALAECLRGEGVEVPDPKPEDGGVLSLPGNAQDDPRIKQALDKCDEQVRRGAEVTTTS